MAPEQCEGKKQIDHRVDVYGLGCILFQMVTGRVPFPGEGFGEVLVKHLREPPPLPTRLNPQVPKHLEKIILHALAKKPEFRFASMDDFRSALRDPERFALKMEGNSVDLNLTPSEPMPAPVIAPPVLSAPPPAAPPGAPQRLDANAPTVMGAAPPEVERALAARQQQGAAFDAATAPGRQRQERRTVAQPLRKDRGEKRSPAVWLAVGAGVILLGALGVATYGFLVHGGTVQVAVKSSPEGAEVVQEGRAIGRAPMVVALPRSDKSVTLEFRKDGYLSSQRSITPTNDVEVTVRLLARPVEKVEEPPPPPAPPPPEPTPPEPVAVKSPPAKKPHSSHRKKEDQPSLLLTPSF
jgi:hypothetical protein